MEVSGERWAEAELKRIQGEIFQAGGDTESSRKTFEDAVAVARQQNARALELRALQSLREAGGRAV
jgi:hypothetical protein